MNLLSIFFYDKIISNDFAFILGLIISNLFLLFVMYIFSLYWKTFNLKNVPKISLLLLCFPLTTLIFIYNIKDYVKAINNLNNFGLFIIGLFASNLICIYIYYNTIITISSKTELEKSFEKMNLEYQSATTLLSQHNLFLHNIRNQSKDMLDLLNQKKYNKLNSYIHDVYSETTNIYNMINSNYKILDLIINDRLYIFQNNNIQIKTKIETTDFGSFDSFEMERLFKNIIDLCIHSCITSKLENPYIYINSKKTNKQTMLVFVFSSTVNMEKNIMEQEEINQFLENNSVFKLVEFDEELKETTLSFLFLEVKEHE